jgi:hypothetical protein
LLAEQLRQRRNEGCVFDGEAVGEIIPEADFEFGAGLGERDENVAAIAAVVAAGAAAEATPGDVGADVVFGSVGMQRDFRAIEHPEQFGLVGVEPRQQPVERDNPSRASGRSWS